MQMITALAAAAAAFAAWRGVDAWRRQIIGSKQIELAAEILEKTYEIENILQIARSPVGEGSEHTAIKELTEEQFDDMGIAYLIPFHRISENAKIIAEWRVIRFRARAIVGEELIQHFNNIYNLFIQVRSASIFLAKNHERAPDQTREKMESRIWDQGKEDVINAELQNEIRAIENILIPIIKKEQIPSYRLNIQSLNEKLKLQR